ncbi:hypothetical protein BDR05DRAFT_967427 [Suillus weaverae]|nr:hypothetical protein BDR05DRAFT_967427 [Suillus weaverae]
MEEILPLPTGYSLLKLVDELDLSIHQWIHLIPEYHHRPFVIGFIPTASIPVHITSIGIGYEACMYFWSHLY